MARKPTERETSKTTASRRTYLQLAAASIPIAGGLQSLSSTASGQEGVGGPPNADNWDLTFEDTFSTGSLDTSSWEVGFGWGMETNASAESISAEHVALTNDRLHISASPDNGVEAGCINTKDKVTVAPGTYMEARLRPPKRTGFLPAFWGKPNSEAWPPEIDVFELFQNGSGADDWTSANYNVHYSSSTDPGDGSTHESDPTHHRVDSDLTNAFHVYGCKWLSDSVEFYFDGEKVGESTDSTAMEALRRGAPFYLMLNIHIDKIGTTDKSDDWNEELVVDWVRVWESSSGNVSITNDSADDTESDSSRNYFWARSGDGEPITFEFQSSGGNITRDSSSYTAEYWVSDNGNYAGGTTSKTGADLPGFWFEGEITDLQYDGDMELYVNNQQVDPDQYTTDAGNDSTEDAQRHYFWARSGDGDPVTFQFESTAGDISRDSSSYTADYWVADDGTSAGGTVSKTGADIPGFWYHGELTNLQYDGDLQLYIDDERVDPADYGNGSGGTDEPEPLPRTLALSGDDSSSRKDYEVTVTEQLQATDSINEADEISDGTATGYVTGWTDTYRFSGSVETITVDGDATVTVDGTPAKRVTMEADASDAVTYILETSGTLVPDGETLESADEIHDGRAFGTINGEADEFWLVGGDVTYVSTFRGDVVTSVDGDRV